MTHEEITNRYIAILSKYKEIADETSFVYGAAAREFNQSLEELQKFCDHRAPRANFIDDVACPFCHKVIAFQEEQH